MPGCDCIDGKVIRYYDGRKIRCPLFLGRGSGSGGERGGYEVTRYGLRAPHPPACTCVVCVAERVAGRRSRRGRIKRLWDWVRSRLGC